MRGFAMVRRALDLKQDTPDSGAPESGVSESGVSESGVSELECQSLASSFTFELLCSRLRVSWCVTQRMAHLGLRSHWVGEVTTPPIGAGDVLLLGSGSGRTSCLVSHAETAAKARNTLPPFSFAFPRLRCKFG